MAKKAAKKTLDTTWASVESPSKAAFSRFEQSFAREMGVDLGTTNKPYQVMPTGSLALDVALGIGGLATGRIHEMWGPEHAGKTTLAILQATQFQHHQPDKKVAWLDMEQTFDPAWATKLGLDVDALWRPPVRTAEEIADYTKRFMQSGLCSFLVIDSVGSMISVKEFQKEADEDVVAAVAKIVTRMVKQTAPVAASNGTTVMVINQVRSRIGGYGADEDTTGGWALKHITTTKTQVRRGAEPPKKMQIRGEEAEVGYEVVCRVQKNKTAPRGRRASMWLFNQPTATFGPVGIDQVAEAVDLGKRFGVLTGTTWLTLPDGQKFNGAKATADYLRTDPGMVADIRARVLAAVAEVSTVEEETEVPDLVDPVNMGAVL